MTARRTIWPGARRLATGTALLGLVVLGVPSVTATTRSGSTARYQQTSTQTPKPAPAPAAPASRAQEGRGFGPVPGPGPSTPRPDFFPWWKDADVIKQVGLTSTQVASIDRLYERRLKQIQLQVEEFTKQSAELNRMISERVVKPDAIELQASRMMTPKVLIDTSRIKMLYEMSLVMTAEQNKKLQDVVQRLRDQRDRGRGRGPSGR